MHNQFILSFVAPYDVAWIKYGVFSTWPAFVNQLKGTWLSSNSQKPECKYQNSTDRRSEPPKRSAPVFAQRQFAVCVRAWRLIFSITRPGSFLLNTHMKSRLCSHCCRSKNVLLLIKQKQLMFKFRRHAEPAIKTWYKMGRPGGLSSWTILGE